MKEPSSQWTPYSLRMHPDLRERLQQIANEQDRSLHWVINKALNEWAAEKKTG